MIAFIGWLACLVALITGLAMIQDARMDAQARAHLAATFRHAFLAFARGRLYALEPRALRHSARMLLRIAVLLAVVAGAGVLVLFPGRESPSVYEVVLRVGLAAFMALQAPCPWLRFITVGAPPERKGKPRVH